MTPKYVGARMVSDLLVVHEAALAHRSVLRFVRMSPDWYEVFKILGLDKCLDIRCRG